MNNNSIYRLDVQLQTGQRAVYIGKGAAERAHFWQGKSALRQAGRLAQALRNGAKIVGTTMIAVEDAATAEREAIAAAWADEETGGPLCLNTRLGATPSLQEIAALSALGQQRLGETRQHGSKRRSWRR